MEKRIYQDDKITALILYLLNELDDQYDFQTLSEIIVWDGAISLFVFNDCFHHLVECKAIEKTVHPDTNQELYVITSLGRELLESFDTVLIKYVKERIMRSATRLLAFKKNGSTVSTEIESADNGTYLICKIKNSKFNLLELKMFFDNHEEADLLQVEFEHRAEQIYSGILALLTGNTEYLR